MFDDSKVDKTFDIVEALKERRKITKSLYSYDEEEHQLPQKKRARKVSVEPRPDT